MQIKQQVNLSQTEQIHLHEPCRTQTEINPKPFTNFFFSLQVPECYPLFSFFFISAYAGVDFRYFLGWGCRHSLSPPPPSPPPHPSERWLMNPMPQLALLVSLELFFLMFSRQSS